MLLQVRAGERVCIRGNIPQLGEWGDGAHVPMHRDGVNHNLWVAQVVLPFVMEEHCTTGIFQFKYAIETTEGEVLEEGQDNRTVLRTHLMTHK
jgi:hypothetical protein